MMTAKKLETEAEILQAKRLLHRIYVGEMKWTPKDSPTGFRIEDGDGDPYMDDDYAEQSTWFGTFDGSKLVCCMRYMDTKLDMLEFEHYHQVSERKKFERVREINRFAMLPDYMQSPAPMLLVQSMFDDLCASDGYGIFVTASKPQPFEFCLQLGFEEIQNGSFRYTKDDPADVTLMVLDDTSGEKSARIVRICEQTLAEYKKAG